MFSTNVTFTIYDIVSHIIPGSAFLLLVYCFYPLPLSNETIVIAYFLVAGYLLGHIFNISSSLLIRILESKTIISSLKRQSNPILKHELYGQIKKKYLPSLKSLNDSNNNLAHWQIADVIAVLSGYDERATLLARESLYRSLISLTLSLFIFLCFAGVFTHWSHYVAGLLVTLTLMFMFYDRHNLYETIKKNQVYAAALVKMKEK